MEIINYLISNFKDLFNQHSFTGCLVSIFLIIIALGFLYSVWLLIQYIFMEVYELIDTIGRPINNGIGKIIGGRFTEEVGAPGRGHLPESFKAIIKIEKYNGNAVTVDVSKDFYKTTQKDQTVKVGYMIGRFSKNVYIKTLE